jgi:hypothetical protein
MTSLADARAGETVVFKDGRDYESPVVVARTTATLILIPGASAGTFRRFYRKGGYEVGRSDSYRFSRIEAGTPERIEQAKKAKKRRILAAAFQHRNWENVSLEKMEQIDRILREIPLP